MKKSDGKLFDKQFVHFMWDDSLEGKEGFVSDSIDSLVARVNGTMIKTIDEQQIFGLVSYGNSALPFSVDGIYYRFFYWDPNYDYKKAWLDGKRVQYMTTIYVNNGWKDVPDEWYWDGDTTTQYRIKPEKIWRPFKDLDELKKAWYGKIPFPILNTGLEEPFIWVRWEGGKEHKLITGYYNESSQVFLCGDWVSLERLFKYYEFLDGTPCGVEVKK